MHPQTPKNNTKKTSSLTPSFSFGTLGPSPSAFRFVSPRNMNLLSSLSPHRLFNRFCRSSDENSENQAKEEAGFEFPESKRVKSIGDDILSASIHEPVLTPFTESHSSQNFHNESTAESIGTAESVDLWSFANDSHGVSMNLTAITEINDDKDSFFSPHELFLERSPMESEVLSSRYSQSKSGPKSDSEDSQSSRKRKMSDVESTPCSKLSARVHKIQSPPRTSTSSISEELKDPKKVWSKGLDDELMRCFHKYMSFKASHSTNEGVFRGTSQNRVLSRMLEKKTGIHRTQKQVSGRVLKLLKTATPSIKIEPAAESTPKDQVQSASTKATPITTQRSNPPKVTRFEELNMSFRYRRPGQNSHIFTCLSNSKPGAHKESRIQDARKSLPQNNHRFLADFDEVAWELKRQEVDIHDISCDVNLRTNFADSSSPVSPMTNPQQFVAENGVFVSYMKVHLRCDLFDKPFISLKSQTTVYKDTSQVLFRSEELVNGYRDGSESYRLDVPFLNQFWAGFLTFMVNGASDFEDLRNIVISQLIYDDDCPERKIHAFFVFRFAPTMRGAGNASVEVISLAEESISADFDDLETILASSPLRSSPFRPSPEKVDLRIQTKMPHARFDMDAHTSPTFNSGLLHENNVNYEFAKSALDCHKRPIMISSKSTTNVNFEKRPTSSVLPHGNHSFTLGNRHHSAGQMGSFFQDTSLAPQGENCYCNHPPSMPQNGRYSHHTQPPQPSTNHNVAHTHQPHAYSQVQQFQQMQQMQQSEPGPYPPFYIPPHTSNAAEGTGPIRYGPFQNQYAPAINSAPASQVKFFMPGNTPAPETAKKSKGTGAPLKIMSMIRYDPSKSRSPETKSSDPQGGFHSFQASSEIVFKSE